MTKLDEPRHQRLDDIGDKRAEPGTRDWASYVRLQIQGERHDVDRTIQQLKTWLEMFVRYDAWRLLSARDGSPFMSFDDFCQHPEPEGAGIPMAIAEAVLREKDTTRTLKEVMMSTREAGSAKGGRPLKGSEYTPLSKSSTNVDRIASRLKRDHPAIAKRVMAGEFTSMRAAGLEAGIVKPRLQVPADIDEMANYLRRKLPSDDCRRLATLLLADQDE